MGIISGFDFKCASKRTCEAWISGGPITEDEYDGNDKPTSDGNDAETYADQVQLNRVLNNEDIVKVFHNAKFDYKFIKHYLKIDTVNIHDTYLCEKILHCGKTDYGFGLAKLVKRYLDKELDKSVRNRFTQASSTPFTDEQIIYGAKDVEYLIEIYSQQVDLLNIQNLTNVAKLENQAVVVFSEIEYNGLEIDTVQWKKLADRNKQESTHYKK